MPVELHPGLAKRLRELTAAVLPAFGVVNGAFLDFDTLPDLTAFDAALPDGHSPLRQQLSQFISESPMRTLLISELSDALGKREFSLDAPRVPLTSVEPFIDVDVASNRLIQGLESLPHTYRVLFSLNHPVAELFRPLLGEGGDLSLSSYLRLVTTQSGGAYEIKPLAPMPVGLFSAPQGVSVGPVYLEIHVRGYVPKVMVTRPLEHASFLARSFLGLCIAQRLIRRTPTVENSTTPRRFAQVYLDGDPPFPFYRAYEFPLEVGVALDGITLDVMLPKYSVAQQQQYARNELRDIGRILSAGHDADRLLRAAQWLFDSYTGSSALLHFIQATTALEILLGEKEQSDLIGLGALIGNRCAFLIGRSRKQREEILADFKRIYDTRSRIVHRGHSFLSAKEENDLWHLRWMCSRVIQEECRLLLADGAE